MPLLSRSKGKLGDAPELDKYVSDRITRGQGRLNDLAPERNECWQFYRGNTYVIRTQENQLVATATGISARGQGLEPWEVRTRRPILTPFVRQEVSAATQRTPSYDVTPTNTDPETIAAAKVAEKVALYGYDKWGIKAATENVVTSAVVADEGFAWPYWDANYGRQVGEVVDATTGQARSVYEGDICIRTYTANEVGWEPGQRFEDAKWYFIQQARPIDDVLRMPGVLVSELSPDATDKQTIGSGKPTQNKLVLVIEYFERPSPKNRNGRRLVMVKDKRILPEEGYPLTDLHGQACDEPFLHKLSVLKDPDSDRDHGLVKFCLDALRTYQDCNNKALEYKNHMVPQVFAPPNTILQPLTQEPNAVFDVARPDLIKFRDAPPIPPELFNIMDRAYNDIARIFSQNVVPSNIEAAKAIQALLENDQNARGAFLMSLAEWHSRLMRHCLTLVQRYYSEPRDLMIVGEFGPDYMYGFQGVDLMSQAHVRVLPGSLLVQTRDQVKQDVMLWAQQGWITPEEAMQSIKDGSTENLGAGFEADRARAYLIIQKIKQGMDALIAMPDELADVPAPAVPVTDPATGQTVMQPPIDPNTGQPATVTVKKPGWAPRQVDNVRVHKAVFAAWMKSADWLRLDDGQREVARQYWKLLDAAEAEQNAKAEAQKSAMASSLGAANAAKPQFQPMPSLPNPAAGNPQN